MGYALLADAVVIVHFAYVAVGGLLAWRWPRMLWLHLVLCQNPSRRRAGLRPVVYAAR